jgi:hypothetical protein
VRWVDELQHVTTSLPLGREPFSPNVLGLPALDPEALDALRGRLRDGRPAAAGAPGERAASALAALEDSALLRPLFR